MDGTPNNKGLIQPIGRTTTPTRNLQQNGTNPNFNLVGLGHSPGMNQAGLDNTLQLREMNQTPTPTSVMRGPGAGQTLALPSYQNQNRIDSNSMGFLQSSGPNQIFNNTNFLQSPDMNQTLSQANLLQSPGMNQTFNLADPMQLYGMNPNINPMGYQQQFAMNPNLGPMGYQQLQMNTNDVHAGNPTGLSDGSTAFASTPSCIDYFPTPPPTVSGSSMLFNTNQLMSPNMEVAMNQGMTTNVAPHQQIHLPVVNGLHNPPLDCGMSMSTNMIPSTETHLPVANGFPNFTNMNVNTNPQYLTIFSGLQNTSAGNGMNVNANFLRQPRCAAITGLQNPSIGNGIPQQAQSQLPGTPSIQQASRQASKTKNQILGPQHPGPTRVKKMLSSNTASSLGNCLNKYNINRSITPNMTSAAPSITPGLRAAMEATLADSTQAVAQTVTPESSNGSQNSSRSPHQPAEQKVEQKAEQGQSTTLPAVQDLAQQVPQPPAGMLLQQPAQKTVQNAIKKTVQKPARNSGRRRVQKPLQRPLILPVQEPVHELARDTVQDSVSQQPAQQPVKEPVEQQVQQTVQQQQPIQDSMQQPVQQPVKDSAEQHPTQQTELQERTPPAIPLGDLLVLISDRHWEFWHRVNILKVHELAVANGSDAHIRQAWHRRLFDRWFSSDYIRVYELGGFLYEVYMDLYGTFTSAKAIELREYAGLLGRIRPMCCDSLDYAQALAAAKARAEGNCQPEFDDLDKAQGASDAAIGRLDETDWWELARAANNIDEWVKDLMAQGEAEGEDETKK